MLRRALIAVVLLALCWRCASAQDAGPFVKRAILPQPFERQPFQAVRLPSWVEETTGKQPGGKDLPIERGRDEPIVIVPRLEVPRVIVGELADQPKK